MNQFQASTLEAFTEYVQESHYVGGFVRTMHPEELMGDVLLYGFHTGRVMDLGTLEYFVQRVN